MRKQGDLGSKARKERARKARARTERCVSREALLGSFVPDVLNLTMPCFIDVLPKKKMMRKCAGKQWFSHPGIHPRFVKPKFCNFVSPIFSLVLAP